MCNGLSPLCLILVMALASCAPKPTQVPAGASVHWTLKGSFHWEWTRQLEHGCATWSAKDTYASVQFSIDPTNCEDGPGLWYFTVQDFLVFQNYWPWSSSDYTALISYDSEGMTESIARCPYTLSSEQIASMRIVAGEALAVAATDAERRTVERVIERLASTDGGALASNQSGCTDLPENWYNDASRVRQDTWRNRVVTPRRPR